MLWSIKENKIFFFLVTWLVCLFTQLLLLYNLAIKSDLNIIYNLITNNKVRLHKLRHGILIRRVGLHIRVIMGVLAAAAD